MAQGYYTLPEAAKVLAMSVDELKAMAQKGKIRSFQDRGTLRFRIQDVQELARQRGVSSDPDLVLGEASLPPKKSDGPRSPRSPVQGPKTPPRHEGGAEVLEFEFDDTEPNIELPPPSGTKKPPSGASIPQAKAGP